jgi:hypothetical protein
MKSDGGCAISDEHTNQEDGDRDATDGSPQLDIRIWQLATAVHDQKLVAPYRMSQRLVTCR